MRLIVQNTPDLHKINDYSESGFVLAPFKFDQHPFIIIADEQESAALGPIKSGQISGPAEMMENLEEHQAHVKLVARALKEIRKGNLDKVVVSRQISKAYERIPLQAFEFLLSQYPNALAYLWSHPELGCWMGASPELFLSVTEDELLTYSLAGTKPYVEGQMPVWEPKETEEQEIVSRYILEKFSEIGLQAKATVAQSSRAGNLWHLRSEIKVQGSCPDLDKVLRVLHPTPAVCGTPKSAAIQFIEEFENYDRKFYTGFLGELNMTKAQVCNLFVNLRCMEWADQTVHIYVGGGITGKSSAEAEWMETQYKSQTMLNALFNSSQ